MPPCRGRWACGIAVMCCQAPDTAQAPKRKGARWPTTPKATDPEYRCKRFSLASGRGRRDLFRDEPAAARGQPAAGRGEVHTRTVEHSGRSSCWWKHPVRSSRREVDQGSGAQAGELSTPEKKSEGAQGSNPEGSTGEGSLRIPAEEIPIAPRCAGARRVCFGGALLGGPGSFRRRMRYAVLAGLNAEGFLPVGVPAHRFLLAENIGESRPLIRLSGQQDPFARVVPFERFKRSTNERILLLWFDEDVLDQPPAGALQGAFLCLARWVPDPRLVGSRRRFSRLIIVDHAARDGRPEAAKMSRLPMTWPRLSWRTEVRCLNSATADDATLVPHVASFWSSLPSHGYVSRRLFCRRTSSSIA